MYQRGVAQQVIGAELHISMNEIRRITKAAGVYIENRGGMLNRKSPDGYQQPSRIENYRESAAAQETEKNMKEAILAEHIMQVRSSTKVGDRIRIRTDKGITVQSTSGNSVPGVVRDAVVIGTMSPVFCLVKLVDNGVMESVMWRDIYIAQRNGKSVIG